MLLVHTFVFDSMTWSVFPGVNFPRQPSWLPNWFTIHCRNLRQGTNIKKPIASNSVLLQSVVFPFPTSNLLRSRSVSVPSNFVLGLISLLFTVVYFTCIGSYFFQKQPTVNRSPAQQARVPTDEDKIKTKLFSQLGCFSPCQRRVHFNSYCYIFYFIASFWGHLNETSKNYFQKYIVNYKM